MIVAAVNFIVGDNGSGKSSVISGVVMALGGKVKTTGQGSTNADVIKYGASQAKVTVTLKNTGDDGASSPPFMAPTDPTALGLLCPSTPVS